MTEERLQKIIAQAGIASRRKAEEMIVQGLVTVNGAVAQLGQKANPQTDEIRVNGRILPRPERYRYIMLNKPKGVLSTVERQAEMPDRPTVVEMVSVEERVYPVGRLDLNSEGLIILTNDGALTNRITHPRYGHEKTYKVLVAGGIREDKLEAWRKGDVVLPDGFQPGPCVIKVLESQRASTLLRIVLREGHKRQIRDIAEQLGHPVIQLTRTHIGALELGDLPPGHWRDLTPAEVEMLQSGLPVDEPSGKAKKFNKPKPKPGSVTPRSGSRQPKTMRSEQARHKDSGYTRRSKSTSTRKSPR
jgi:pseudouridine synthase